MPDGKLMNCWTFCQTCCKREMLLMVSLHGMRFKIVGNFRWHNCNLQFPVFINYKLKSYMTSLLITRLLELDL